VHLFLGLRGESPENGSFLGYGWRLLGIFGPKSSNAGLQRLLAMKKPALGGPFSSRKENSQKQHCLAVDAVLIATVSRQTP
jgi:hypothetical protein